MKRLERRDQIIIILMIVIIIIDVDVSDYEAFVRQIVTVTVKCQMPDVKRQIQTSDSKLSDKERRGETRRESAYQRCCNGCNGCGVSGLGLYLGWAYIWTLRISGLVAYIWAGLCGGGAASPTSHRTPHAVQRPLQMPQPQPQPQPQTQPEWPVVLWAGIWAGFKEVRAQVRGWPAGTKAEVQFICRRLVWAEVLGGPPVVQLVACVCRGGLCVLELCVPGSHWVWPSPFPLPP